MSAVSGRRNTLAPASLDRSHRLLEHDVELSRLGQVTLGGLAWVLGRLAAALGADELVRAEQQLACPAVDERIGEALDVARGLPEPRMKDDRRSIRRCRRAPAPSTPTSGHGCCSSSARRSGRSRRSSRGRRRLRGREDEPAPAAQGDDLVHGHVVGHEADTLTTWASRRAGARSRGRRREAGPASAALGSARRTRGSQAALEVGQQAPPEGERGRRRRLRGHPDTPRVLVVITDDHGGRQHREHDDDEGRAADHDPEHGLAHGASVPALPESRLRAKAQAEHGAAVRRVLGRDDTSVRARHLFDDREPEPRAGQLRAAVAR